MRCTYSATLQDKLRPMGFLALTGRDGESKDEKSGDKQDKDDATSDKSGDGDGEDGDKGDKPDPDKLAEGETVAGLRRQLANSEEARNRNADKRKDLETANADLKAQIAQLQKDGTPDDAVKQENEKLTTANATLASTNQQLMLQIAMRDDKAHDWVDPDAALRLADLSDVEFDEKTLKPVGLKAALDALAKSKAYLLKPKDKDDADEGQRRGTGKPPAGGKQKTDADSLQRKASLAQKYPALRR